MALVQWLVYSALPTYNVQVYTAHIQRTGIHCQRHSVKNWLIDRSASFKLTAAVVMSFHQTSLHSTSRQSLVHAWIIICSVETSDGAMRPAITDRWVNYASDDMCLSPTCHSPIPFPSHCVHFPFQLLAFLQSVSPQADTGIHRGMHRHTFCSSKLHEMPRPWINHRLWLNELKDYWLWQ